jgi:hypothetical protein
VQEPGDVPDALRALGLGEPRPTLVLVGGAGGLAPQEDERLRPLFAGALVPLACRVDGAVVDGGTDSGVMRLMGEAAAGAGRPLPLVGVAAAGTVMLPGDREPGRAALEANHTHFVLVPGRDWGDESEWLSLVATALAGPRPSVTVLVNGGETAWRDVEASIAAGRPVIVLDGSGRAADDIASALRGTAPGGRGYRLAASGLVQAVPLGAGLDDVAEAVRAALGG